MNIDSIILKRWQIKRIFGRHRGSSRELAKRSGRDATNVSHWFRNPKQDSPEIEAAAQVMARELLALENKTEKEASHAA